MPATSNSSKVSQRDIKEYRGQLLNWYDRHRREIPWRAGPGQVSDPYHVWLSEIMCQQTTVQAVKAYYLKFLQLWPTVQDLASAPVEDVMAAWAGLGYYARARNLHKCTQIVANDLGGAFPDTQEELKKLPGIGDYTSAAIAAIAFNQPTTVVDGNVERVIARFFAVQEPLPGAKKTLKALAHQFYNGFTDRPGDLAQAFMDLGAGVCIPKAPRCTLCPLSAACAGLAQGIAAELPRRADKAARPQRYGNVYWMSNEQGEILFHRREDKGLLGGMLGLPTTNWSNERATHPDYVQNPQSMNLTVHHTFTHFDLELSVFMAQPDQSVLGSAYNWRSASNNGDRLPSVFKKVFKAARAH